MWMWHSFFRSDDVYLEDAEEDISTKCRRTNKRWSKLYNKEHHNLSFRPNIKEMLKEGYCSQRIQKISRGGNKNT